MHPGNPVRVMLAQRLSEAADILAKLGGECAAEYKYDGIRIQAHRTADGRIELFTRGLERIGHQFPDLVEALDAGLGPREAILEGEAVAFDAAAGELRPFQEVMFRRRKHGISEAVRDVPVGLFCFDLLYADGEDLTRLPYPQRRARLAAAITLSDRLRLTTAVEVSTPGGAGRRLRAGDRGRLRGAAVQVGRARPPATRPAPAAGSGSSSSGTTAPSCPTPSTWSWSAPSTAAAAGAACTARCCWPRTTRPTDVFRTVGKCGTGFSDAELAALPERLAPLARPERPAEVDARTPADVWFTPALVLEVLSAELTLSPNHTAGWGRLKEQTPGWRCASRASPAAGGTTRARATPPPPTSWSTSTAPPGRTPRAWLPTRWRRGRIHRGLGDTP